MDIRPPKRPNPYFDIEIPESNGRFKRLQGSNMRIALPPSPEDVVFRILCASSKIGSVIGKGGTIVKAIRQETGAKIKIADGIVGVDERVIFVTSSERRRTPKQVKERETVDNDSSVVANGAEDGDSKIQQHQESAPAQEALIRVYERIVGGENSVPDEEIDDSTAKTTARLLVPNCQIGCLLGRGGKIIEQMRDATGAQIRILPRDQLPGCALQSDELVQIVGDSPVVKSALQLIAAKLRDNPPRDRIDSMPNFASGNPLVSPRDSFHSVGPVLDAGPMSPMDVSTGNHVIGPPGYMDYESPHLRHLNPPEEEITIRLLCPNDKIGSVIGKGGNIIRALRDSTGAKIKVADAVPGCDERVVIITANEHPGESSSAQSASIGVYERIVDGADLDTVIMARLLVPSNQIGCILGRSGSIITEMRKTTRANIRILSKDDLPKCATENDELVQIVGDMNIARDALFQVISRLKDNIFRDKLSSGHVGLPLPFPGSNMGDGYGGWQELASPERLYGSMPDHAFPMDRSPALWGHQGNGGRNFSGFAATQQNGPAGFGRPACGAPSNIVEVLIPATAVSAVLGKNGSNIAQIRKFSGAKVNLLDSKPGATERMVEIYGTPSQALSAQSLLEAFVISSESNSCTA